MALAPYQQRVVEEQLELDKKRGDLDIFLMSDTFPSLPIPEQCRLTRQYYAMTEYSNILGDRIKNFPKGPQ